MQGIIYGCNLVPLLLLYLTKTIFLFWVFAVVLLDTTEESSLQWTQYPYGPSAATPGVSVLIFTVVVCMCITCCGHLFCYNNWFMIESVCLSDAYMSRESIVVVIIM